MKKQKSLKMILLVVFITVLYMQLHAEDVMIASAAGFKKPVMAILESFKKTTGIQIHAVFGNMQMAASQAKHSDEISCIIGDKKFLDKVGLTVQFKEYYPIGKGFLVLAFRKGIEIKKIEDLLSDKIESLFIPQAGKAIFGIAGTEALKSYGYDKLIAQKVTRVTTVPQVVSYLLTGEADAGFINLTEALANKEKLGGYIVISEDKYTKIMIVAGVISKRGGKTGTQKFIDFLHSKKAVKILVEYGLQ